MNNGQFSSNYETVMILHINSPTQQFIELYHGFIWNYALKEINIYSRANFKFWN